MKRYKVAIIGAGTAGLSARREVAKKTDNYIVIDDGPLGTTCARVGCMPSKVLIQVAADFHRRLHYPNEGIFGGEELRVDMPDVMKHVRKLRDRFVRAVEVDMGKWTGTHLLRQRARLKSLNLIEVGDETIYAEQIIIATGSRPIIPKAWDHVKDYLIDTDSFFELEDIPKSVGVIGLGVIGIEIGQSLARLGVKVQGITLDRAIGGLQNPELQDYAIEKLQDEIPITIQGVEKVEERNGQILITTDKTEILVDKALVTMGRTPNIEGLGIENLDIPCNDRGIPIVNTGTYRIGNTPLFLVGDVNGQHPILHEAADEGRIAGYNATHEDQCFRRRVRLGITFSSPNMAVVGESYRDLKNRNADFVTGKVSFEGQGRAIVKQQEIGRLHVYVERKGGALLGCELFAPDGEHLAHLLAWAMASKLNIFQTLSLPFYHPVTAEGLRTALREAASLVEIDMPPLEVLRCQDPPVGSWS